MQSVHAPQQSLSQEASQNVSVETGQLGNQLSAEQQYSPGFANMQNTNTQTLLNGQLGYESGSVNPALQGMQAQGTGFQMGNTTSALNTYGSGLVTAAQNANPELAGIQNSLASEATAGMANGGMNASPQMLRAANQQVLQGASAAGMAQSDPTLANQVLNQYNVQIANQQRNISNAQSAGQFLNSSMVNPYAATLQATGAANQQTAQGMQLQQNQAGFTNPAMQINPFPQYASNLNDANQSANYSAAASNALGINSLTGALGSAGGSGGGGGGGGGGGSSPLGSAMGGIASYAALLCLA